MATSEHFLARLLELPRIEDPAVRRGIFRQSVAALGMGESNGAPLALAGVAPRALGRSIQLVVQDGLLDDLDFIAPAAAGVALYQIAGALPLGSERRAIGRKVLGYLYKGNAGTFAALASRMALGSTRPLEGPGIRARVALALELRHVSEAAVDRLALAIVTRRELTDEWVSQAATGSLPERRLAARLLERAAREAARRAESGDTHALKIFRDVLGSPRDPDAPHLFRPQAIGPAWHGLLADRETLVWRNVAIARGLLSRVLPRFLDEAKAMLRPDLSPTEWRRGATTIVARIAVDRSRGLTEAMDLLDGPLLRRDPGIAMAMVWGLTPVAEVEPEAADELLEAIAAASPISVADSIVELRREVTGFGSHAADLCSGALRNSLARPELDDGLSALARCILEDLEEPAGHRSLHQVVRDALNAFGETGTEEAFTLAMDALRSTGEYVSAFEAIDVSYEAGAEASSARRRAMQLLRHIDATLLESGTLRALLLLGRPPGAGGTGVVAIDDLDARLARWLLHEKRRVASPQQVKTQATLHQRQLRALLHLIDSANTDFGDDHERRMRVRSRWSMAVRLFTEKVRSEPTSRLTRAIIATIARAFDALVRDGAAEAIDVFLYTSNYFTEPRHISIIAEASMVPDVTRLLSAYLRFVAIDPDGDRADVLRGRLEAFAGFLEAFPSQTTLRAEAFRTTAGALARALGAVVDADTLNALAPQAGAAGDAGPLGEIEECIGQIQQLIVGAERRCAEFVSGRGVSPRRSALAHAIENAIHTSSPVELIEAATNAARAASDTLPAPIAALITDTLPLLSQLDTSAASRPITIAREPQVHLPAWLPSRRIIGGFYVITQLGGGNVGTVFVVKRAEERHDADAERFALKVPEYDTTAARTMSEKEFLTLFREEAGALLSLPEHSNIARFVTFDAGAKPKPILVMELIEGVSCERIVSSQSFTMELAIATLEGVLSGLEAMHGTGMAHLDVKPSNVILRESDGEPVLVDFGLAGRKLRPGCATLCYGAPEIWEGTDRRGVDAAKAADVYAFGCFAYEVMTSLTLFDGVSDVAIMSGHLTHDGMPEPIGQLAQNPAYQQFAAFLYRCLRADPFERATMDLLQQDFRGVAASLQSQSWPLAV